MNALTVLTSEIRQHDGLYSLNDLHSASGSLAKNKPANFMRLETTQELMKEIKCSDLSNIPAKSLSGRNGGTYVCKELVYAYAMWISPKFHLAVIRAFDALASAPAPEVPLGQRWLFSIDTHGATHSMPVPNDAFVMTADQFIQAIAEPNGMRLSSDLMFACLEALQQRIKKRIRFHETPPTDRAPARLAKPKGKPRS